MNSIGIFKQTSPMSPDVKTEVESYAEDCLEYSERSINAAKKAKQPDAIYNHLTAAQYFIECARKTLGMDKS